MFLDNRLSLKGFPNFDRLHHEGNTIVLITHERDIAAHADRVIALRDGRIESDVRQQRVRAARRP